MQVEQQTDLEDDEECEVGDDLVDSGVLGVEGQKEDIDRFEDVGWLLQIALCFIARWVIRVRGGCGVPSEELVALLVVSKSEEEGRWNVLKTVPWKCSLEEQACGFAQCEANRLQRVDKTHLSHLLQFSVLVQTVGSAYPRGGWHFGQGVVAEEKDQVLINGQVFEITSDHASGPVVILLVNRGSEHSDAGCNSRRSSCIFHI